MDNQEGTTAGALPPGAFDRAFAAWKQGFAAYGEANRALEVAQQRQTDAINELPEGDRADMAQLETIADATGIVAAADQLTSRLAELRPLFYDMFKIAAPSPFGLFLKLEAIGEAPWFELNEYTEWGLARLMADAGTLALQLPKAWVDRWRALGGDFGVIRKNGEPPSMTRGMVVDLDLWTPTDQDHPSLEPHTWLIEHEHHAGAVKVLEGLMTLVPGLREDVRAIVAPTISELVGG